MISAKRTVQQDTWTKKQTDKTENITLPVCFGMKAILLKDAVFLQMASQNYSKTSH